MRASNWRASIWRQAVRLLPPDAAEQPHVPAGRPDVGLDALDFVELVQQVEQQFDFRFSAEQLHDLRAVLRVLNRVAPCQRRQLYAAFFAQLMQQSDWLDQ